ncbi:MAG: hypothetical protein ABR969_06185 [Sedimentisphaerales bacterium]|jgi:hypothetical protein
MKWLSKLFGHKTSTAEKTEYFERDNVGTCFTSGDQAGAHRLTMRNHGIEEPCIDYCFKTEAEATTALLQVSCIKRAKDTNNLISTEILKFGVFKRYADVDDAFIALLEGKNLTHDLWDQAKRSFKSHGGQKVVEIEPPKTSARNTAQQSGNAGAVAFQNEVNKIVSGFPATYRHYTAPNKASAMAFLQKNPVTRGSFFLVVKTPEGTFCRDVQGFFEQ